MKVLWNTGVCIEDHWRTTLEISMYLVQATKEPNVMAGLNLMLWKHQQSMKSSPKRIQNHALDTVDPTSKIHAQNTQINLTTNFRTHHLQDKTTMNR